MKLSALLFLAFAIYMQSVRADSALDKISEALNVAQKHVDEYGTISVSAPILTYARSNEFAFRLTNGANFYFTDAKTNLQGRAATFNQSFQSFMMRAQAEADPTVAGAYMAATQHYLSQNAAFQLQQSSIQQAAEAQFQSALSAAATNTSAIASNQAVAEALRVRSAQVYGTNGPPLFPTASSFNTNLPAAPSNFSGLITDTNYGRLQGVKDFLGLLTAGTPGLTIPNRAALLTAAGDNAVESFFRALGDSSLYTNFLNREVYYGAMIVSANPGWRTQKDWAAEVNVHVDLEFSEARRPTVARVLGDPKVPIALRLAIAQDYGYPYMDSKQMKDMGVTGDAATQIAAEAVTNCCPLRRMEATIPHSLLRKVSNKPVETMVISPMIDSENYDMAASYRSQSEFALSLAAALTYAGAKGQAEIFEKFAKSRQFDIENRSALATVNAFSGQDGSFGFQFGPRPRALQNPADRKSGPGNVLERQAFPALLVIATSQGELEPRVSVKDGYFRVEEPYLAFRQMRRWVPLKRRFFSGRDWYLPAQWFHPKLSESERMSAVDELESAARVVEKLGWDDKLSLSPRSTSADALRERIKFYERELIGSVDTLALPPDRIVPQTEASLPSKKVASIDLPGPNKLRLSPSTSDSPATNTFTFVGNNLDLVTNVISFFPNTKGLTYEKHTEYLLVRTVVTNTNLPIVFKIALNESSSTSTLLTPAIYQETDAPKLEIQAVSPRSITVKKNDDGTFDPPTTTLLFAGTGFQNLAASKDKIQIISGKAEVLNVSKPGEWIEVNLRVTGGGEPLVLRFETDDSTSIAKASIVAPGVQVNIATKVPESQKSTLDLNTLTPLNAVIITGNTNAASLGAATQADISVSIIGSKTNAPAKQ